MPILVRTNLTKLFNWSALLLFALLPCGNASLGAESLELLQQKNHFAMIRHAKAPGTGDPAGFQLGDCRTQRNLSSNGIAQAKTIGKTLTSKLGADFHVFTSQWCRCRDTAKHLGGKGPTELPVLNSFFQGRGDGARQTADLKKWLKENLSTHHPLVLVTHQVNITELTEIFPAEGEVLIFKMEPDGTIVSVGRK